MIRTPGRGEVWHAISEPKRDEERDVQEQRISTQVEKRRGEFIEGGDRGSKERDWLCRLHPGGVINYLNVLRIMEASYPTIGGKSHKYRQE